MTIRPIQIGGQTILVETIDDEIEGDERFEHTAKRGGQKDEDIADRIRDVIGVLTAPVRAAFEGSGAEEWAIEFQLGFSGEGGVPFFAKAKSDASIKVTAKWKKGG